MSNVNWTCANGHTQSLEEATRSMPSKQFRCVTCGFHLQLVDGKPTVLPSGFVMPGERKAVVLNSGKKR